MNITIDQIKKQYEKVKNRGWMPWFETEAQRAGTTCAHLLGFGSRETNLENVRGDFRGGVYHGYGVLQVDIGTFPDAPRVWSPANAKPFIEKGVGIYLGKVNDTVACVGKRVNVRRTSFVGKAVDADDLRRVATAAYNCGRWAHYHFSRGENVDSTTTGGNYSRDVYDRAVEFAKLREADGERDALRREIALQGKYARESAKQAAGFDPTERVKFPPALAQVVLTELNRADFERSDGDPADIPSELVPTIPNPTDESAL